MSAPLRPADELLAVADRVMERVPAGSEAEVTVTETSSALTRYANGAVHQNVADTTLHLRLRLVRDNRCGVAEVQVARDDAGASLAATAEAIRSHSPEGEQVPLFTPDDGVDSERGFSAATGHVSPEERADAVSVVCAAAAAQGQKAYGIYETTAAATAMVSSAGLRRHARRSQAEFVAVARGADGSAYAARHASDAGALGITDIAIEVVERCQRAQGPQAVPPGRYEVILAPYAVAEMLEYLGLLGLGGLAVAERRSFMRFGERLLGDTVTITDDPTLGRLAPLPFDGEGATTQRVTLIDRGVCAAVVHDSVTAARAGVPTTGHSFPQPNSIGPLPHYLTLATGTADSESMVASCRRGLLITRFWYVRPVHPLATIITGMTRDGTFLVEDGHVVGPVRDLRFTQSIVEALTDVRAVGAEAIACRGYFGATLAPWLHIGGFTFSS